MIKTYKEKGIVIAGLELWSGKYRGLVLCDRALKLKLECLKYCLKTSGNGRFVNVRQARQNRVDLLIRNPRLFYLHLDTDIKGLQATADSLGVELAIRLNVFSDKNWRRVIEDNPGTRFYDYSKQVNRYNAFLRGELPPNYDLTFSASEVDTERKLKSYLDRGGRVAFIYRGDMPETYLNRPVIDGDTDDARWLNPPGSVIGLYTKGKARSHPRFNIL
jgi:hypothetical protein